MPQSRNDTGQDPVAVKLAGNLKPGLSWISNSADNSELGGDANFHWL